ncbi:exosortase H [ANME-1 cluster archaeon GoMg4]|nr:exosortase H [ANME-1 cluster archaeon GoMg4]
MVKIKAKGEREKRSKSAVPVRKDIVTTLLERARENKEALRYVTLFLVFCLVFYLVYYFFTVTSSIVLVHLREITALILSAIFSVGGANVILNGATLSINGFGLEIIDECTAVFSSIVYCSAVLAYPTTAKNKGLGIVFGVPSLYAINILRLSILALVGIYHPDMFEFVHVYLWQASFIIFVVVIFLMWLHFLSHCEAMERLRRSEER